MQSNMISLTLLLLPILGTVAFTAKLNACDSYPSHSGVLKFANVLVNEGDGYSADTGLFTCPVDGFYYFSVHASVYGRGQCAIFKNKEKMVSLYHTTLPEKCSQVASMSSVIKLTKKDIVSVNIWGSGKNDIFATEDNDTVFAGVLLGWGCRLTALHKIKWTMCMTLVFYCALHDVYVLSQKLQCYLWGK